MPKSKNWAVFTQKRVQTLTISNFSQKSVFRYLNVENEVWTALKSLFLVNEVKNRFGWEFDPGKRIESFFIA